MTVTDATPVDYYELLGIPPTASMGEVHAAFARQYSQWGARSTENTRADRAYAEWVLEQFEHAEAAMGNSAGRQEYDAARAGRTPVPDLTTDAAGWHDRAQHYLDEGNSAAAYQAAREAMSSGASRALPWLVRGFASAQLGNYQDAAYELAEAARLMPEAALPHLLLGESYGAQGKWEAALAEFEKGIARASDSAPTIAAKAWATHALGQDREAARLLEPLLEASHGDDLYGGMLAIIYHDIAISSMTPMPGGDGFVWTSQEHVDSLRRAADRIEQLGSKDADVRASIRGLRKAADEGEQITWDTSAPSIYVGFGVFLFLWGCAIGAGSAGNVGLGVFLGLLFASGAVGLFIWLRRKPAWKLAAEAVGKGNLSARLINARNRTVGAVYRALNS
jgi:tetratricopeptide (TPR) repeat protein